MDGGGANEIFKRKEIEKGEALQSIQIGEEDGSR
jgi:hypothetical protein